MKTKDTIKYVVVTILVALAILALLLTVDKADGAQSTPTCPSGSTCHWLMEANSYSYVLCANGRLGLVENGEDSWYLECEYDIKTDKETSQ